MYLQPAAAGFQKGHQLALVVAGTAGEYRVFLPFTALTRIPGLEKGAALPQVQWIGRAAHRNARRTGYVAHGTAAPLAAHNEPRTMAGWPVVGRRAASKPIALSSSPPSNPACLRAIRLFIALDRFRCWRNRSKFEKTLTDSSRGNRRSMCRKNWHRDWTTSSP